jgi:hypothetical protein
MRPNPFRYSQSDADRLSAEDQHAIDMISELAAAIMQVCGKDLGLSDEEIRHTPQVARDMWTGYFIAQRANGNHP